MSFIFQVKLQYTAVSHIPALFKDKRWTFPCFKGPDQEQQKVEPHHTVVFGDGDCVKFENKVRDFISL